MDSPVHRITYRSVKRATSLCALAVVSTLLFGGAPVWGAQLVAKLTALDDPAWLMSFARSVAISGDYIAVGAAHDGTWPNEQGRGAVYVFKRSGAGWVEQAKLVGSQAGFEDCMGRSVAIEGDVLVAGAPDCDFNCQDTGSAYVFRRNGDTWAEEAILVPSGSTSCDRFGGAVAISGERIVVGAPSPYGLGHAYVFHWTGSGWSEEGELIGSDTAAEDGFASRVDIASDLLIAGAPLDDAPANDSGSAYVFRRTGVSWSEESALTLGAPAGNEGFGTSVAVLTGDQVAVGAPRDGVSGSVSVFVRDAGIWVEQTKLVASDAGAYGRLGSALAASTGLLLVGNPDGNGQLPDRGSAYVFRNLGPDWYEDCNAPSPEPANGGAGFGQAVAVDGATAGVGTPGQAVYLYRLDPCIPALSGWGVLVMVLVVLGTGVVVITRRTRARQ